MKRFTLITLCSLWLACGSVAAQSVAPQPALTELTHQLASATLSDLPPIVEKLDAQGGDAMLPVFQAMRDGNLYSVDATHDLVIEQDQGNQTVYVQALNGQALPDVTGDDVSAVPVNNLLRSQLSLLISKIQIHSPNPKVRQEAVLSLLADLNPVLIQTLEEARVKEKSAGVKDAMDLALAMNTAIHSNKPLERVAAIEKLSESQRGEVRNLLNRLKADNTQPEVQAAAVEALKKIKFKSDLYGMVDTLFFGLSLGSVLLLAAIGLAITFGVMGVINMAHGEMMMLGAYTTYVVQLAMPNHIDESLWVAIPAAFVVAAAAGVLIERCVIRFLHGRPLETLLATFGISLALQQAVRTVFSPLNRQVQAPSWMSGSVQINPDLSITLNRLCILAFALIVFFALQLVLKKTSLGLNVRAVSQNRNMAKSMGIKTDRVDAMTFGLGSGIAGIAGVALSQLTNVGPNLGQSYIIDSFMVVVFGGVGNLLGTLVAAFTLGVANKFLEPVTGAVLASILVLVFIILFIQKRPKGLFPQKGRAAE